MYIFKKGENESRQLQEYVFDLNVTEILKLLSGEKGRSVHNGRGKLEKGTMNLPKRSCVVLRCDRSKSLLLQL